VSLTITCPDCERRLHAPPTVVGKKIRCPSCQSVFVCPTADEVALERQPAAPPEDGDAGQPAFDQEEERPRRRKRRSIKKRSSVGLWIGLTVVIGAALLLVCGGGAAAIYLLVRNKPIPDADWVQFATPDGECSVLMPGTPILDNSALKGAPGNKYLLVRKQDDVFFAVAYVDLPTRGVHPALLTTATAGERDALQQKVGGTVVLDQDATVLGYTGREFQIRAAPPQHGVLMERVFLVPKGATTRLYVVGAGGSPIEPGTGAAAKFFDSLTIKATPTDVAPNLPIVRPFPPLPPELQPPPLKLQPKK
jgi:hypothetical protein